MSSSIESVISRPPAWLSSSGVHDGIVVSTRVRLARNCQRFNFRRTLPSQRQRELVEHLLVAMGQVTDLRSAVHVRLDDLGEIQRQALIERQLVSRELASGKHPAAVSISADQVVSIMMNEEDHIRLQVINAGFCVAANVERAIRIDTELERALGWAFHERFGYLTACPTNVGTGMRASAMLHLPALAESGEIKTALRGLVKLNMTVRGLHGEGSEPSGHCFQISNQRSLGITEAQIVSQLSEAVEQMIGYERAARQALLERSRWRLEDKIFRAWGILSQARTLTGDELMTELSWIRLGAAIGLLEWKNWKVMDQLFLDGQPAHLQLRCGDTLDAGQRDRLRADLVRKALTIQDIQLN